MCDGRCGLAAATAEQVSVGDPGDGGVSRRAFISLSTLAAVAAVLASACGDGIIGGQSPTGLASLPAGGLSFKVSDYPGLAAVGGIVRVDTSAGPIALVHATATTYAALSMICTHQGSTVNIQGGGFLCPNHGARFSATGQWLGGQQTTSLVSFPTTFDAASGTLTVGTAGVTTPQPQQPGTPGGTGTVNLIVDLAQFPALAQVGGVARVDNGTGIPVGAARISATQFDAYSLVCTHQGATVNLAGSGWVCPAHGAQYSATGAVTLGPATLPLVALTATYDAATNKLTITGSAPTGGTGGGDDGPGDT